MFRSHQCFVVSVDIKTSVISKKVKRKRKVLVQRVTTMLGRAVFVTTVAAAELLI